MGRGVSSWSEVVTHPGVNVKSSDQSALLSNLSILPPIGIHSNLQIKNKKLLRRLLQFIPCLYTQLDYPTSADAIVHLCEITLGNEIKAANVYDAFIIQNPSDLSKTFLINARQHRGVAGDISEALCSEVLTNEGLPPLEFDAKGWPEYTRKGHISLNKGKMRAVKAFGDILIPCAPSNLIISVKTQAAKERLLYSANMIEGIGFGFFNDPKEFWSPSRMNLYKRMGFTAIYLPDPTHSAIMNELNSRGIQILATNVNGKDLYRKMSLFGDDMVNVAGKHTLHL
jgi:hypothetical protein